MTESTKTQEELSQCCSNPQVSNYNGELVCINCGLVHAYELQSHLSLRKDVGEVSLIETNQVPVKGVSTRTTFSYQTLTTPKNQYLFRRLAHLDSAYTTSKQHNLKTAYLLLSQIGGQLEIPLKLKGPIMLLYERAVVKLHLSTGRSIKKLLVACICVIFKQYKIPRGIEEIVDYTQISKKILIRYTHLLYKELNIKPVHLNVEPYLESQCTVLNLSSEFRQVALKLLEVLRETNIDLAHSKAVAAAIIYVVNAELLRETRVTQVSLAIMASTNPVTIRKYSHLIQETINLSQIRNS
jgi:transcription initiation factor TFIIB